MLQKGFIKTYNSERGFGFIRPEDGGKDIFFHIKDYPMGNAPKIQERVSYWVEQTGDKLAAKKITRLDIVQTENSAAQQAWQVQPAASANSNINIKPTAENTAQTKTAARSKNNPNRISARPYQLKRQDHRIGRLLGLISTVIIVAAIAWWTFGYLLRQPTLDQTHQNHETVSTQKVGTDTAQAQLNAAIQAPPTITKPQKSIQTTICIRRRKLV